MSFSIHTDPLSVDDFKNHLKEHPIKEVPVESRSYGIIDRLIESLARLTNKFSYVYLGTKPFWGLVRPVVVSRSVLRDMYDNVTGYEQENRRLKAELYNLRKGLIKHD